MYSKNMNVYKAVINEDILETTKILLNAFRAEPQINQIFSKHWPFIMENARIYLYPPREERS